MMSEEAKAVGSDAVLLELNETELLALAREQGLPTLRRGMPLQNLIAIVAGYAAPTEGEIASTRHSRFKLQMWINSHWGSVRSQLPGCTGQCTIYPCSEGRHLSCYMPNKNVVG